MASDSRMISPAGATAAGWGFSAERPSMAARTSATALSRAPLCQMAEMSRKNRKLVSLGMVGVLV